MTFAERALRAQRFSGGANHPIGFDVIAGITETVGGRAVVWARDIGLEVAVFGAREESGLPTPSTYPAGWPVDGQKSATSPAGTSEAA